MWYSSDGGQGAKCLLHKSGGSNQPGFGAEETNEKREVQIKIPD